MSATAYPASCTPLGGDAFVDGSIVHVPAAEILKEYATVLMPREMKQILNFDSECQESLVPGDRICSLRSNAERSRTIVAL